MKGAECYSRQAAAVRCKAPAVGRNMCFRSTYHGQRIPVQAVVVRQRRSVVRGVFAEEGVRGAFKYLAEAASAIFKPGTSDVDWSGSGSGWSGSITHHEEAQRLRQLYKIVQASREQITGCTDPSALNYDPAAVVDDGSCTFIDLEEKGTTALTENVGSFITSSLSQVWGHNFKGDDTEPEWAGKGYPYSGEKVSQRDISRLLQYEKVVKEALDKAEENAAME